MALLGFQGRLLAGVGKELRIYDLGMRQLLRKAQAEVVPTLIVGLANPGKPYCRERCSREHFHGRLQISREQTHSICG
jgi:hypothetical protein